MFEGQTYKMVESNPLHISANPSKKKKILPTTVVAATNVQSVGTFYIWGAAAILLLSATWIFILVQKKKKEKRKMELARLAELKKIKTVPLKTDPLKESRDLMMAGDFGKFYASVNRALWKAISDKLQLPASELNKLNIASGLRGRGWSDEEIIQLKNVLNECEMKLYTPEFSTTDMQRVFASAQEITRKLEA